MHDVGDARVSSAGASEPLSSSRKPVSFAENLPQRAPGPASTRSAASGRFSDQSGGRRAPAADSLRPPPAAAGHPASPSPLVPCLYISPLVLISGELHRVCVSIVSKLGDPRQGSCSRLSDLCNPKQPDLSLPGARCLVPAALVSNLY